MTEPNPATPPEAGASTTPVVPLPPTSATTSIPAHVPPAGNTDAPLLSTVVPEEFKERPYLKDLLSLKADKDGYSALFKKLDGAEKLIGKKAGIPEANAPKEEWDKFYSLLRPTTADEYELKTKEGTKPDEAFTKKVKEMFHQAGLSKSQAALIQERFDELTASVVANKSAESKKLDDEFDGLMKSTFAAENVKMVERAKSMLQQLTPDNVKPFLDKVNNESLVVLTAVLNKIHATYIGEDKGFTPGSGAPISKATLQEEGRRLMASKEYQEEFNPQHEAVKKRVAEIYQAVGKM